MHAETLTPVYVPSLTGQGVSFMPGEIKPAIMRRIEMIGKLNDRRLAYMAAGDGESLLRLADEYEEKKMPVMANIVRKEAEPWTVTRKPRVKRRPIPVEG